MEISDIRQLIATGKQKLVLHAISVWQREFSHMPEPLLDTLKSDNLQVLEAAFSALAQGHPRMCAPFAVNLLKDAEAGRRRVAVKWISREMGDSVSASLRGLLSVENDAYVLSAAVMAAGRLNFGIDELAVFLGHPDARVRANAARVVAQSGDERIRELLEPLVADDSIRVQNEAIKGLSSLIAEEEIERLVRNRLASGDELVRSSTAFVLAELPLSAKIEILAEVMADESEQVVECAARALASLENDSALLVLIERYMHCEDSPVEKALISIFSQMPAAQFLQLCEQVSGESIDKNLVLRKVLRVCQASEMVDEYRDWVLAGIKSGDGQLRVKSLRIVIKGLSFFSDKVEAIVVAACDSGNPEENALGELLRWRSGKLQGFENLKKMLFSGNRMKTDASADVLRMDNGLISRRLLQDAERAGHIKGVGATQPATETAKPVILPDS